MTKNGRPVWTMLMTLLALACLSCSSGDAERNQESDTFEPGKPVPSAASLTAQDLVAAEDSTQRSALTPELQKSLGEERLYPKGSRITLEEDSWHEEEGYANASAVLQQKGEAEERVLIGFVKRDGQWRVVFVEKLSDQ